MSEPNETDSTVFDSLALGVDAVTPPAELRERILNAARESSEADVPMRRAAIWRPRLGFAPGAVAAMVAIALIAGVLVGDAIGRNSAAPPATHPQSAHFTLSGHGGMSDVNGTVLSLTSEGVAIVTLTGLPQLPPSKVYQLWLITATNRADPAGVFTPNSDGGAVVVVDHSLAGYKLMAVTVEAGPSGVSAPTQQPEIYGPVT